jgi:hypothetical protein
MGGRVSRRGAKIGTLSQRAKANVAADVKVLRPERPRKPRTADVARWIADLSPPAASWGSSHTATENRRKIAAARKRLASWGLDGFGQPVKAVAS